MRGSLPSVKTIVLGFAFSWATSGANISAIVITSEITLQLFMGSTDLPFFFILAQPLETSRQNRNFVVYFVAEDKTLNR
jgi:hypothetical protein